MGRLDSCTLGTCPEELYLYGYRPNVGINVFFVVIFSLLLVSNIIIGLTKGGWLSYTVVIALGALTEVIGYIGRILGWKNPFSILAFSIQYGILTVSPVFTTAAIYLSIKHLATTLGRGRFDINPKFYPRVFISADLTALVIQATGGGLATSQIRKSTGPLEKGEILTGTKIMIVGLVLQVVSICIFLVLFSAVVNTKVLRHPKEAEGSNMNGELADGVRPRPPQGTRTFVIILLAATILILLRSAYRVAELSEGTESELAQDQWLFIGLDAFMVAIATALLVIFHPARILHS